MLSSIAFAAAELSAAGDMHPILISIAAVVLAITLFE